MKYWKVFCEEHEYPGLWQRWFKSQCAALGWNPGTGFSLHGKSTRPDWTRARNCLNRIESGDKLVVQLKHNRVGRIGEIVRKEVGDEQWEPTTIPTKRDPKGHLGRRIIVRWDLGLGPTDPNTVILLPKEKRLPPNVALGTIQELDKKTFNRIKDAMSDEGNWVGLQGRFDYERSLSEYIAAYPHRVEDGLARYPNEKVRERVFPDRTRSDVLLIDSDGTPVVVECKQGAPTLKSIAQLRGYMKHVQTITGRKTRGILVHGGAPALTKEVRKTAVNDRSLRIVRYSLDVDFVPSA